MKEGGNVSKRTVVKKGKKRKTGAVWCNQFQFPVHYAFIPTEDDWYKEQQEMKFVNPMAYPKTAGCCVTFHNVLCGHSGENDPGKTVCLVTVNEGNNNSFGSIACTILHESLHVFQEMMKAIGEEKPGDEIVTYTVQQIFMELYRAYIQKAAKMPEMALDFKEIRKYYANQST